MKKKAGKNISNSVSLSEKDYQKKLQRLEHSAKMAENAKERSYDCCEEELKVLLEQVKKDFFTEGPGKHHRAAIKKLEIAGRKFRDEYWKLRRVCPRGPHPTDRSSNGHCNVCDASWDTPAPDEY